jgi:hypothetical protein
LFQELGAKRLRIAIYHFPAFAFILFRFAPQGYRLNQGYQIHFWFSLYTFGLSFLKNILVHLFLNPINMETPKKYSYDEKLDSVNEPASVYETESKFTANKSEELHPILIKLLEKSRQDSFDGKGISHEEALRRIRVRFPFLK